MTYQVDHRPLNSCSICLDGSPPLWGHTQPTEPISLEDLNRPWSPELYHPVHRECLQEWRNTQAAMLHDANSCPECRQSIDTSLMFPWTEKVKDAATFVFQSTAVRCMCNMANEVISRATNSISDPIAQRIENSGINETRKSIAIAGLSIAKCIFVSQLTNLFESTIFGDRFKIKSLRHMFFAKATYSALVLSVVKMLHLTSSTINLVGEHILPGFSEGLTALLPPNLPPNLLFG